VFDHHCPWIGNCVARRNYRFFISFLVATSIMLVVVFASSLHLFLLLRGDMGATDASAESPVTLVLMIYCGLIFLPVSCLTGYHGVIISSGETTKEEVKRLFKEDENPYDRGCLSNWYITLCFSPPASKLTRLRALVLPTHLDDDLPPEEEREEPGDREQPLEGDNNVVSVESFDNTESYDNNDVDMQSTGGATPAYPPPARDAGEVGEEGLVEVVDHMDQLVEVVTMTASGEQSSPAHDAQSV